MHICLVTPWFPPQVEGGVAIATGRLVACLLEMGHRITVLTASLSDASTPTAGPRTIPPGLSIHYRLIADPRCSESAVDALGHWMQALHERDPIEVILAYFVYPAGYLATMLGEILEVPVVCSCRGNDISKDMFIAPQSIATVLQRSTRLIFVSPSLLHMADALVPCQAKATVIANAVDGRIFRPVEASTREGRGPVTLGTSGILRWKKGIDVFLPLVRQLCADQALHVLVAGYGLDTMVDRQIAAFLESSGLPGRVEIRGFVPHQHMASVLQCLDLYVSTSYQEGMPNGVLEAMSMGLPVVATDADGTAELVVDGVTGYLCRMGDLETLVRRCQTLIGCPALRRRLGNAGRQRVLQRFHPHREAAAVVTVLRQACQGFDRLHADPGLTL
ncbi:D-inositol-3-phosphate glycosyltransferase [Candidatus Entotheonellaceae bacterium PAL068K]